MKDKMNFESDLTDLIKRGLAKGTLDISGFGKFSVDGKFVSFEAAASMRKALADKKSPEFNNPLFSALIEKLRNVADNELQIPGLGRFVLFIQDEVVGRNPRTGESITVPAKANLKFAADPGLLK